MDFLLNLDYAALIKIIGIDLILGLDNAIVIALACATLATGLRNKAIFFGTAGAILARILFLFIGFWLIALPVVKFVAGAYLVYLAYKIVVDQEGEHEVKSSNSVWGAVGTIILADLMMSLDNVIAVTSAASGTGEHGFGYAVFGIVLSIPIILFASKFLLKLLDKFPIIIWAGSALIAWVGIEMLLKEQVIHNFMVSMNIPHILVMTAVTVATMTGAYLTTKANSNKALQAG